MPNAPIALLPPLQLSRIVLLRQRTRITQHCLSASQSVEVAPAPVAISILTSAGFAVMLLPRLLPPLFVMLPLDADPLYFVSSLLSLTIFEMASPEEPSSRDTVYVLSFGSYALTVHSDLEPSLRFTHRLAPIG